MSSATAEISALVDREYREGFVTDIESDTLPPQLISTLPRLAALVARFIGFNGSSIKSI
jgi:hypothetical protein